MKCLFFYSFLIWTVGVLNELSALYSGNKFFIRYMYIYTANIISSVTYLFTLLKVPFDEQFYFHNVSFIKFFLLLLLHCVLSQILLPTSKSQKFSCKFVLPFTFRSLIHLKLIFVCWMKCIHFSPIWISNSSRIIC